MLSPKELYRYDRQIKLDQFGIAGQEKIKQSSALVIGAGGLGCPVLTYLCAAGVGKLGIVDFDTVNETNLHRQILFSQQDIGNNKAFAAADRLKQMNPLVAIESYPRQLDAVLALTLFDQYDVIVDATDNFSTRYLVNDVCVLRNKPFVYGSVFKTEGQVSVFNYKNGPTYRCLFPHPPAFNPSCEEVGVLGVLCGITGTLQANEVLKILSGSGDVLSGKLTMLNAFRNTHYQFEFERNERQIQAQVQTADTILNFNYALFCGEEETKYSVTPEQLKKMLLQDAVQIFDIRQEWEDPKLDYENVVSIPLQEIERAVSALSRDKKIVVVCQYGTRSNVAVDYLRMKHHFKDVAHLRGGLINFMAE